MAPRQLPASLRMNKNDYTTYLNSPAGAVEKKRKEDYEKKQKEDEEEDKKRRDEEKRKKEEDRSKFLTDDCAICLEKLSGKVSIAVPCNHAFHTDCLNFWMYPPPAPNTPRITRSNCPVCRQTIINDIKRTLQFGKRNSLHLALQRVNTEIKFLSK
jgi:hypothetical protein